MVNSRRVDLSVAASVGFEPTVPCLHAAEITLRRAALNRLSHAAVTLPLSHTNSYIATNLFDNRNVMSYIFCMKEPKPKRETKEASIAIRTTSAIKEKAEDAALAENRSLSQWIESLIISALKRTRRG